MDQKIQKVVIDCDPGIDDSLALMLALSMEEIQVEAITIVCGNSPADMGFSNTKKILKHMGRLDIPIYVGAERPLKRPPGAFRPFPVPGLKRLRRPHGNGPALCHVPLGHHKLSGSGPPAFGGPSPVPGKPLRDPEKYLPVLPVQLLYGDPVHRDLHILWRFPGAPGV